MKRSRGDAEGRGVRGARVGVLEVFLLNRMEYIYVFLGQGVHDEVVLLLCVFFFSVCVCVCGCEGEDVWVAVMDE